MISMQVWQWQYFLWMIVAPLAALYAAYLTTKRLTKNRRSRLVERTATISQATAWIAGILATPVAWFLGIVVGGTPGGGVGDWLGSATGTPTSLTIPIGISVGIFLVVWVGVATAACAAFVLAQSVESMITSGRSKPES